MVSEPAVAVAGLLIVNVVALTTLTMIVWFGIAPAESDTASLAKNPVVPVFGLTLLTVMVLLVLTVEPGSTVSMGCDSDVPGSLRPGQP